MERRLCAIVALFVLACAVVPRMPYWGTAIMGDESVYAYVASAWLHGMMPYRDAADVKPPGLYLIFALPVALFGFDYTPICILLSLATIATSAFVFLIGREIGGDRVGLLAAALVALFSSLNVFMIAAVETMFIPFTAAGFYALIVAARRGDRRLLVLAGIMFGFASLIKQPVLAESIALSGGIALVWGRRGIADALAAIAVFLAGVWAVWAPILLYFLANGALGGLVYWCFQYPVEYANGGSFFATAQQGVSWAGFFLLTVFPAITLGTLASFFFIKPERNKLILLASWALGSLAATLPGNHYLHFYVEPVPVLSVLSGALLAALIGGVAGFSRPRIAPFSREAVMLLVLTGLLAGTLLVETDYYGVLAGVVPGPPFGPFNSGGFEIRAAGVDIWRAADAIRAVSGPNDTLIAFSVYTADASLYIYSGRFSPIPEPCLYALKEENVIAAVGEKKPRIVVADIRLEAVAPEFYARILSAVATDYELSRTEGPYRIYVRRV